MTDVISFIDEERKTILQNKRVNDAIQTALERGELTVTSEGYLSPVAAQPSKAARETLQRAQEIFESIGIIASGCATTHGDPGGGLEMVSGYADDGFRLIAEALTAAPQENAPENQREGTPHDIA